MVRLDQLPNRPVSEAELEDFTTEQNLDCPVAVHSLCTHCDTEGIVDALIREDRSVYALHHGWDEWELTVLEEDMAPEQFRMMATMMNENRELLMDLASGPDSPARQGAPKPADPDDWALDSMMADAEPAESPPVEELGLGVNSESTTISQSEWEELLDEETRAALDAELDEVIAETLARVAEDDADIAADRETGELSASTMAAMLDEGLMEGTVDALVRVADEETIEEVSAAIGVPLDSEFELMVDPRTEERFLDLYAELLCYVNRQFDVLEGLDTPADLVDFTLDDLLPLRQTLYEEATESLIDDFVAENPADLSTTDLDAVSRWRHHRYGDFVVVRHLSEQAVFLDWDEPPKAFGVRAVQIPFTDLWTEESLPVTLSDVVLLPFEGGIITDGWLRLQLISFGASISRDIDDAYEEAKHRVGLIQTLPVPEPDDRSDAEALRFYLKNKRNRNRYADEILALKDESEELEWIYHQEMGKARARSLGRELRDTNLKEAYFAIYDDRIIASGTTEAQVTKILDEIMPEGTAEYPYIYHFDP